MNSFIKPVPQSLPIPQDRASSFKKDCEEEAHLEPIWSSDRVAGVPSFIPADSIHGKDNLPRYAPGPFQHQWRPTPTPSQYVSSMSAYSSFRPVSPYGFKPIKGNATHNQIDISTLPRFSPSPMALHGKESPSYSVMTSDTENMTQGSMSSFSPVSFRPLTPCSNSYCLPTTPMSSDYNSFRSRRSPTPGNKSPGPNHNTNNNSKGRLSPFTKKDDDDEVRKTRIKTEMCMHYENNRPCPFGSNCTYAHGEEELQMTRLLDLQNAGLIDVETYRIKPCLTWVATGSCPFGKRCTGIHDPRISSTHSSWLPHTETQGNTLTTDVNVEATHQKRNHTVLYGNPFGSHYSMDTDTWSDLYKTVCHVDYSKNAGWVDRRRRGPIDAAIKLEIAILMRGDLTWQFKFRPQHAIHDEICMVLQQRAFRFKSENEKAQQPSTPGKSCNEVVDIALSAYDPSRKDHIMVHELAFGPDEDPTVRTVSLWFNIEDDDVTQCTQQQAKRFRWKKGIKRDEDKQRVKKISVFEKLDSFPMIRPCGKEAFVFATDLLEHRLQVLQGERISSMRDRHVCMQQLEKKKKALQEQFQNMLRSWHAWDWPINHGRAVVTKTTPVPPVDGEYNCENEGDATETAPTTKIWNSFVSLSFDKDEIEDDNEVGLDLGLSKRLRPLALLAEGNEIASDRTLPKLHSRYKPVFESSVQESCWRSLLVKSTPHDQEENEWSLVEHHFKKSRSNKVLSIIQDKTNGVSTDL